MMNIPTIKFVGRPLWQRILIAFWPPYERAKRDEEQRMFSQIMRDWRAADIGLPVADCPCFIAGACNPSCERGKWLRIVGHCLYPSACDCPTCCRVRIASQHPKGNDKEKT